MSTSPTGAKPPVPNAHFAKGAACARAQAAVELLTYSAFFLFVFVVGVSAFFFIQSQETMRAENAYAQQLAYGFADNIQTAIIAGPGFEETVYIPDKLLGRDYVIAVSRGQDASAQQTGFVYINWGNNSGGMSAPTMTADYAYVSPQDGSIWHEESLIFIKSSIGRLNISNVEGQIRFSKANS